MKKLLTGIAAMTLIISVSSMAVLAAGGSRGHHFTHKNNDGICDYYNASDQFVDNDGDGICDNYSSNSCGNGSGYIDTDGDGVCDNCGSNNCGNGMGFVDADGDGICDNYTAGTSQNGSGFKRGHCGGRGRHNR